MYCKSSNGDGGGEKEKRKDTAEDIKKTEYGSRNCTTKHAKLQTLIPRLQTLVVCSSSPFLITEESLVREEEKCNTYTDISLLDTSKNLVEVKLVKSNETETTAIIIDRVLDTALFSPEAVTLKKFSQFSQERRDGGSGGYGDAPMEGEVTELSSIWLYKPYATYSLLGCHSTKHEEICQNAVPQACPPADIDSFRTFSIEEIAKSREFCQGLSLLLDSDNSDEGDDRFASSDDPLLSQDSGTLCVPYMYGETISTYGYITGKTNWKEDRDQQWWMLTIQNTSSSSGVLGDSGAAPNSLHGTPSPSSSSIRIAIQLPIVRDNAEPTGEEREGEEENAFDTLMKAHWLNGLELGNKISLVGRLNIDDYGILIDNVLNIAVLDQIQSAQKLLPDNSGDLVFSGDGKEMGAGDTSGTVFSRSAMEPLAAAAIALCGTLILIAAALFVLIQFKKDVGSARVITTWK